jgi:hypothetical protein
MDGMLKAIVGFTIAITRIEAKFKLGQNRSKEDRDGTVRGLLASQHPPSVELAEFTRAQLRSRRPLESQCLLAEACRESEKALQRAAVRDP